MKKICSFLLVFAIAICSFVLTTVADTTTNYNVDLSFINIAEPGDTLKVTATVTDIQCAEGTGILAASVFLYYDCSILTPVEGSFSAAAPSGWDTFDGTATTGIWALYTVFDGNLQNTASNDGDITFTVEFTINGLAEPCETYIYVYDCEGTEYCSSALLKVKSFTSTAYTNEPLSIIEPRILIPIDESSFIIDRDSMIIYSQTEALDFNSFSALFSHIGGTLTINAYDYEITEGNGNFIPNGATISVYHSPSEYTYSFTYYLLGDCDCDGEITITDLSAIKSAFINKIPVEGHVKFSMEYEADGVIRIADYLRLKKYILSK